MKPKHAADLTYLRRIKGTGRLGVSRAELAHRRAEARAYLRTLFRLVPELDERGNGRHRPRRPKDF